MHDIYMYPLQLTQSIKPQIWISISSSPHPHAETVGFQRNQVYNDKVQLRAQLQLSKSAFIAFTVCIKWC